MLLSMSMSLCSSSTSPSAELTSADTDRKFVTIKEQHEHKQHVTPTAQQQMDPHFRMQMESLLEQAQLVCDGT